MKRDIITTENGSVRIPQPVDIWMTQHKLADLFGYFVSKVNSNIRLIFKSGVLCETDVYRTCHYQDSSFVEV